MIGSSGVNYPRSSTRRKTSSECTFLSKRGTKSRSMLRGLKLEKLRLPFTRDKNLITYSRSMRRWRRVTSNYSMCKSSRFTNEIPTSLFGMTILIIIRAMRATTSATVPTTVTSTTTMGRTITPTSNRL